MKLDFNLIDLNIILENDWRPLHFTCYYINIFFTK